MKNTVFTGSGVAIVTPFNKGKVDFEAMDKLLQYHLDNCTDAIVVCGTTGESCTLADDEHLKVIDFAVKKVAGKVPLIAGTGSNDNAHAVAFTQEAELLGADAVLLVTPYYNKATQKGLVKHYTKIAQSTKLPCILYNVPSRTGTDIKGETVKILSEIDNIVAIKEATGDISRALEIKALCGDDIDIYSGNDDITVPMLAAGSKGVISVMANIAPKDVHDMTQLYFDGNIEKALELQLKMLPVVKALFCEVNPIPVKTAMEMLGMCSGELRLPLCEMEDKNAQQLKKALIEYGLKVKQA